MVAMRRPESRLGETSWMGPGVAVDAERGQMEERLWRQHIRTRCTGERGRFGGPRLWDVGNRKDGLD